MTSQQLKDLNLKLSSLGIDVSVFRDKHGLWAKDIALVHDIYVQMSDQTIFILNIDEFRALDRTQRALIEEAPSEPLPIDFSRPITIDRDDIYIDSDKITIDNDASIVP